MSDSIVIPNLPEFFLRILETLHISASEMTALYATMLRDAGTPEEAEQQLLAWFTQSVGVDAASMTPATVLGVFKDALAQIKSGQPGENPHHGGIA